MTGIRITAAWLEWPETRELAAAFGAGRLRFVGGCVRDALFGRGVQDVDAATPLTPDDIIRTLEAAGIRAIPTGYDHGTITARVGGRHFEITTLRRDVETDGRHAVVAFTGDWREDAARRDFTLNALYADAEGNVTDYFGGADDARAGIVRFIGDAHDRIREDALRILRFFRFSAYYAHAVDADGLRASETLAALIDTLSGERIADEMRKLLKSPKAAPIIDIMEHDGILRHVIPAPVRVDALSALPAILAGVGEKPCSKQALAALLRTAADPRATLASIVRRWKLSKADTLRLEDLITCIGVPPATPEGIREAKKRIRGQGKRSFVQHMLLGWAEGADAPTCKQAIALAREWDVPQFPVTGDDLIAKGIRPGREMGLLLAKLEDAWEAEGYAPDKAALLKRI